MELFSRMMPIPKLNKLAVNRIVFMRGQIKAIQFSNATESYTERQAKKGRPVSPHVTIYKFPITAISSITNRATGVALTVGNFRCSLVRGIYFFSLPKFCVIFYFQGWQESAVFHSLGQMFQVSWLLSVHRLLVLSQNFLLDSRWSIIILAPLGIWSGTRFLTPL